MTVSPATSKTTTCTVDWCDGYGRDHTWTNAGTFEGNDDYPLYCIHTKDIVPAVRVVADEYAERVGPLAVTHDFLKVKLDSQNLRDLALALLVGAQELDRLNGEYTELFVPCEECARRVGRP